MSYNGIYPTAPRIEAESQQFRKAARDSFSAIRPHTRPRGPSPRRALRRGPLR